MPELPGSGGGSVSTSREGGGAIRVVADGHLAVNGTITANGVNGVFSHGGGGSGGGIWLTCRTFGGLPAGVVQALGGNGQSCGGGGGGGRIALHYASTEQAERPVPPVRFAAAAGLQGADNRIPPLRRAMGTLYLTDTRLLEAPLSGKRFDYVTLVIPGMAVWTNTGNLALDDCRIELERGVSLNVTGSLLLTNSAALAIRAAPVADPLAAAGAALQTGAGLAVHDGCWIYPVSDHTNGAMPSLAVGGDLHVAFGGGIDADAAGYAPGEGPGRAQAFNSGDGGHGGGGYGGQGGSGYSGAGPGAAYGAVQGPVQSGSGGGGGMNFGSGAGGGAIRLVVAGNARIDGVLTARGGNSHYGHRGGGAGGGIALACRTLRGSGLFRVDGGRSHYYGGGGGGGRLVMAYDPVAQAAEVQPRPPVKFSGMVFPVSSMNARYTLPPEMGTLWLPDFQLLADGPAAPCMLAGSRFQQIRLFVAGHETSWAPAALTLDDCVIGLPDGINLSVGGTLLLTNGAALHLRAAATNGAESVFGARLTAGADLVIDADSWIHPMAAPTNGAVVGMRVEGSVYVAAGGGIDATGGGFYPSRKNTLGPGAGKDYSSGGGYGGSGAGTYGGAVYGVAEFPVLPGSPGGWYGTSGLFTAAGRGGGVILLFAGETVHLDGALLADGQTGSGYKGASGSGGSIFLAARRLKGTGQMLARGMPWGTTFSSYSSGGGRIAVWRGVSPSRVEACVAGGPLPRLVRSPTPPAFSGTLDVSSIFATNSIHTGSIECYAPPGMFMIVR